ncbi:uncharacterized protein LOC105358351 [Oryzias latipes]|uniref:uncharacterized protein LOC105358351 n=1 Tax=Oryzias latipes TaxID=8090 RepID=UPI0005CBAB19|nr:uncharacterized protein LOC105358351 [Oryzias latipes]
MEAVVRLLLLLVGVAQGTETFCDSRQDKVQCYGADGGTVFIQLINKDTETDNKFEWKKDNLVLLKGKKNSILSNELENRSSFFFNNGTFMIKNLSKSDSGEYELTLYNSEGKIIKKRSTRLTVNERNPLSILAVLLSLLLICLIAGTVVICVLKKNKNKGDHQIIYAEVQMKQQQKKRSVSEKLEVEVEYSEVKFAERPHQTEPANYEAFKGDSS